MAALAPSAANSGQISRPIPRKAPTQATPTRSKTAQARVAKATDRPPGASPSKTAAPLRSRSQPQGLRQKEQPGSSAPPQRASAARVHA